MKPSGHSYDRHHVRTAELGERLIELHGHIERSPTLGASCYPSANIAWMELQARIVKEELANRANAHRRVNPSK